MRSKISQLWSALQRILEDCPTPHPTSHHTPLPHPSPTPHPTQHPPHPHTPHPTTHPYISSPSGCCCRTTPGRSRGRSPPPPPPRIKGVCIAKTTFKVVFVYFKPEACWACLPGRGQYGPSRSQWPCLR